MKAVIAIACAALACGSVESERQHAARQTVEDMRYFLDARTGLCFAGTDLRYNSAVMTHVPCTTEVKALIDGAAR